MEKIKEMSIDLETYSDVDIKKSGVYKYAESENFEILLFAVSINGDDVIVYDLACGDVLPDEILDAIVSDDVIKWAFNASFERICLSYWMKRNYPDRFCSYSIPEDTVGNYLNPASWRCTMIWSAYMGLPLTEDELQPLVDAWRQSNPNIVALWWDFDTAIKNAIKMHCSTASHGIKFTWRSGMLFITLPSGRKLTYVKPRIGENKFGGESVTYEGIGATKKWERLESYGPKFVENVVQAISRDLLMNAMKTLSHCFICGHVHDKLIIECSEKVSLKVLCQQMARTPDWMPDILLRADGYVTEFYKKD